MVLRLDSSMTPEELAILVERAQRGDQNAFHDLVVNTIGDVRLFIASHVPTTVLGDAILNETYAAIRRELARCPKVETSAWMCRAAATQLSVRLGDATRGATTAKDPLIQLNFLLSVISSKRISSYFRSIRSPLSHRVRKLAKRGS